MQKTIFHRQPERRGRMLNRWMAGSLMAMLLLGASMQAWSQTITFSGRQVPLQQVFAEIKKQVSYVVIFNPELINVQATVSVNARKQPLDQFMKSLLARQPLQYAIVGSTIVVFPKTDTSAIAGEVKAEEPLSRDVAGIVYEHKKGSPVIGASIIISGSGRGTQSDEKGSFVLKKLKDDDEITVTCIGYEKVTMKARKQNGIIYVAMKPATSELDQAVVQAYGITSKRLATGNITRITASEIETQPVLNPLQALQGRVAGMLVTQGAGYAISPMKVEIRGRNSLGDNYLSDPLYVIDGVPLNVLDIGGFHAPGTSAGYAQGGFSLTGGQSPLYSLNPKDIASIEVLKDADATAIYGSRAANGVILITTKKGTPGKTAFSMDFTQGYIDVAHRWKMLNTPAYLEMRREALKNDGITPTAATAPDLVLWDSTRYTDWQKVLLGTGRQTTVMAALDGGDELTSYRISSSYSRQVEVLTKSGAAERATVSSNLTLHSRNRKFSLSFNNGFTHTRTDAKGANSSILTLPPNAPPAFDKDGNLNYAEWNAVSNNISFLFSDMMMPNILQSNGLSSSLNLSYELPKGFRFTATAGYGNTQATNDLFAPIVSQNPVYNPQGYAVFGTTKNTGWTIEPELAYTRFIGKGNLSVQAGGSLQSAVTGIATTNASGYADDNLLHSIASAPFQQTVDGYSRYKYAAVFGRINYNWNNTYILNLNGRRDGSSRFADGRQYGNFWSVGAAWNLSEEKWLKAILPGWISFMKLRSSYGITGSDNTIGDYQYLSQWSSIPAGTYEALYSYNGVQPFIPIHAVNQDYHWEANRKYETAFSLGLFGDKINVDVMYYENRSGDQVTSYPTPKYTGFQSVTANWAAVVQNKGWEGVVRANLVNTKDITWSVNFNISSNQNILLAYPGIELSPYYTRYQVGQPLSVEYYLHYKGVDPQTGNYSFEDYNKDGKINTSGSGLPGTLDDDRYITLNRQPRYFGGIGTDLRYKGCRLNLFFDYRKQLAMDPFGASIPGRMYNVPEEALDNHWSKPGEMARYAKFSALTSSMPLSYSDGAFTDGSYLRLSTLAFSYTLPEPVLKKARLRDLKVFVRVQNVFTITAYSGIDPETQNLSNIPATRTMTGGLSFNF